VALFFGVPIPTLKLPMRGGLCGHYGATKFFAHVVKLLHNGGAFNFEFHFKHLDFII
jgi:hypothetical protein